MNKNHVYRKPATVEENREPQHEPEKLAMEGNNMYRIVGIIDGHYIVRTPKGLKKVKVIKSSKKNINDEIRIKKL
jgi:hypothetical protein